MPIRIDMGLPTITFRLGIDHKENMPSKVPPPDVLLDALFDSCGSLNAGQLDYHLWLISKRPDIVKELRYFDGHQPFDPLCLEGVITDPSELQNTSHGRLTALVRYKTPYRDTNKMPISLSFALGKDVSTNTIIGLPTLRGLEFQTDFTSFTAYSNILKLPFKLKPTAGKLGLPPGIAFDAAAYRKHYDDQLAAQRLRGPSTVLRVIAHEQDFFGPTRIRSYDDTSDGFLRRSLIAVDPYYNCIVPTSH